MTNEQTLIIIRGYIRQMDHVKRQIANLYYLEHLNGDDLIDAVIELLEQYSTYVLGEDIRAIRSEGTITNGNEL